MNRKNISPAISGDALYSKSRVYIKRALQCKRDEHLDQYQLWASLSLELLGKAALAYIHPSLVVAPTNCQSLLAASGIEISTDIKTIAANTVFKRLARISPSFDENAKKFCVAISERRNIELHSGLTPFQVMESNAWEQKYWFAANLILRIHKMSLDEWLGVDRAKAPKASMKQAEEAIALSVQAEIQQAKMEFLKESKSKRERKLNEAKGERGYHQEMFPLLIPDRTWNMECPACGGNAVMAGMQYGETLIDRIYAENDLFDLVEKTYFGEQFHCPVCGLCFRSQAELEAAGFELEHSEQAEQDIEYEPDYGND